MRGLILISIVGGVVFLAVVHKRRMDALNRRLDNMATKVDISHLLAAVERSTTVESSAIALIQGMAQTLKDLKDQASQPDADMEALRASLESAATNLDTGAQALATAVTTNTPAAPAQPDPVVTQPPAPPVTDPAAPTGTGTTL